MKISELQNKDVVNVADGRKLGRINDAELDLNTGLIKSIIIPSDTKLFGWFSTGQDWIIAWNQIVKIGSDVILVKADHNAKIDQLDVIEMSKNARGTLTKVEI